MVKTLPNSVIEIWNDNYINNLTQRCNLRFFMR